MMTPTCARKLLDVEYQLITADSDLGDLATQVKALRLPAAGAAAADLRKLRRQLRAVLLRLDASISEAAGVAELDNPPF